MTPGSGAAAPPEGETAAGSPAAAKQTERPAATVQPIADLPLERRARAAWRLPPLSCGRRDTLVPADHQTWRDEHDVLMAKLGLAPEWQRQRARELWAEGIR